MTFKRLKEEVLLFSYRRILGLIISPFTIASVAIIEHIPTNIIARIISIAEMNHKILQLLKNKLFENTLNCLNTSNTKNFDRI